MKKLLIFVLMLLPMVASADDSGKCGDNVYYTYNEATHTLAIYGQGDMYDYYGEGDFTPWNLYLDVIQSVIIESGVTSIGVGALSRVEDRFCKNLTSVTIPSSVTSIGIEAFYCCSGLTSVNISDLAAWCNIKFSGDESNPLYYAHHLYINGNEITNLDIPNDVTSIGDYAFTSCSGLASVTIPNSVTSIGNFAFRNCSGLTSIQVESSNKYFDSRNNCNAIIDSNNQLILGCKNTIIPNSVTSIGDYAFYGCSGLTSVTIPSCVESIGILAFRGCSGLTSVDISDLTAWCNIKFSGDESNPLYYAHHLYINGNEITNLDIPNDVTSIGDYAFTSCSGLASVTIPNSVTSIGNFAFRNCSGLTSIQVESSNKYFDSRNNCNAIIDSNNQLILGCKNTIIPNSVTSIGDYAFYGCSGLTSITIPNNVTSIDYGAFYRCTGLVYITLPNKLTSIGNNCFSGCKNLTYIYCKAKDVPSANDYYLTFNNTGNITLCVPSQSVNAYKSTSPWSEFNVQSYNYSQSTEKCSKPTISLSDGRFVFNCETPDVQYHWIITTPDGNNGYGYLSSNSVSNSVSLSVFATKGGYQPSDVATYVLSGLVGDVNNDGEVNVADHVKLSEIIMEQDQ